MNHCFYVGQVIMDKNPGVTCVVNKTNMIDSMYRNFKMEVLAGEENMVAKVSLNMQFLYTIDLLSIEHVQIIDQWLRSSSSVGERERGDIRV